MGLALLEVGVGVAHIARAAAAEKTAGKKPEKFETNLSNSSGTWSKMVTMEAVDGDHWRLGRSWWTKTPDNTDASKYIELCTNWVRVKSPRI